MDYQSGAVGVGGGGSHAPPLGAGFDRLVRSLRGLGTMSCRVCEWHDRNWCLIAAAFLVAGIVIAKIFRI